MDPIQSLKGLQDLFTFDIRQLARQETIAHDRIHLAREKNSDTRLTRLTITFSILPKRL